MIELLNISGKILSQHDEQVVKDEYKYVLEEAQKGRWRPGGMKADGFWWITGIEGMVKVPHNNQYTVSIEGAQQNTHV